MMSLLEILVPRKMSFILLVFLGSILHCAVHGFEFGEIRSDLGCSDTCRFTLVESIPENLTYPASEPTWLSTYQAHKRLLGKVKNSLYLSSCYWTLRGDDTDFHDYSSAQGEDIFKSLYKLAQSGVTLKIAQNSSINDTQLLAKAGAQVRTLNIDRLLNAGILHTKMWVADERHAYIGSANYDWRSYTQTKETGVLIEDCPCLGQDAAKIFEVYWYLGQPDSQIPKPWPDALSTSINMSNPRSINYNNTLGEVYLSSSPPPFCPRGRSGDIDAIVNVIESAERFIFISVMDYMPQIMYAAPHNYWPVIDEKLREAAFNRGVQVLFLASHWRHTPKDMYAFLRSLQALSTTIYHHVDIQVKLFTVPSDASQAKIPYARVDHSKYMVTDQHAYIGTSNWSGDYFKYTGGVGFVLKQSDSKTSNMRQQLMQAFLRDWNSQYVKPIF